MPSPFPGIDPFIESQVWEDFHFRAINVISEQLVPSLGEGYLGRVAQRVYIDYPEEPEWSRTVVPDITLTAEPGNTPQSAGDSGVASSGLKMATGVLCQVPQPVERRESFLLLIGLPTRRIVAVIELLSPTNKHSAGLGRRRYLAKRARVLESSAHLIEIDLLRGGKPLPRRVTMPVETDYSVLISRAGKRPQAEFISWQISDRLPIVPIPLRSPDPDVPLDLQAVLQTVYDRARYDRMLDYSRPLEPPADPAAAEWIAEILRTRSGSAPLPVPGSP